MHRFFVSPENILESKVIFPDHISYQLYKVFRSKKGDSCIVFDGNNIEYLVRLEQVNSTKTLGVVLEETKCSREASVKLILYQALIKPDRFEYAIQKSVELGINKIVPLISERTEYQVPSDSRMKRWQNIVRESSEQSNRTILPTLETPMALNQALIESPQNSIIPWEMEKNKGIKEFLHDIKDNLNDQLLELGIFIGPVGGFSEEEIKVAIDNKVVPVSFGPRIFRSETAGVVAASVVLYEFDELRF
jgi:16S rRNA (uracil1498-N3)-methyltransferase